MSQTLDRAIELLIDGQPVDWEGMLEEAADARERALIEELRGLAQLDAEEHAVDTLPADGTLGIAAPGEGLAGRRWAHLELQDEIGRGAKPPYTAPGILASVRGRAETAHGCR